MEPYGGVAEFWWKNREDVTTVFDTPDGQHVREDALEDERRFLDLSRSSLRFAKEHVIID